jgi:hypothetical protein
MAFTDERFIFPRQNFIYDPKMPGFKYWYLLLLALLVVVVSLVLLFPGGPKGIMGFLTAKVFVTIKYPARCPIDLIPGWNLISISCETNNMSVENIFVPPNTSSTEGNTTGNSTGNITLEGRDPDFANISLAIHAYEPADVNDSWKVYVRGLPSWVVMDLDTLSVKKGYWINSVEEINLTLNGTMSVPNFIELRSSWNLVGFPLNITQPIAEAIGSSAPNFITIHKYEPLSSDPWKIYSTTSPDNDLLEMEPNYGYWINMNGSAIWILNQ